MFRSIRITFSLYRPRPSPAQLAGTMNRSPRRRVLAAAVFAAAALLAGAGSLMVATGNAEAARPHRSLSKARLRDITRPVSRGRSARPRSRRTSP